MVNERGKDYMVHDKKTNNEIIEIVHKSTISNIEHWDGWRKLDNSLGATAKIYAKIGMDGKMKVYKYVTRLGNQKNIYIIGE
jgi:hypothetical protein